MDQVTDLAEAFRQALDRVSQRIASNQTRGMIDGGGESSET
jgi:hypothetical protein